MISLERYLVLSGQGNRRHCAYLIRQGQVSVNGKVITDSKKKVTDDAEVMLNSQTLKKATLSTWLLWKPPGYVCQTGEKDPAALDLLPKIPGLALVGRLDRESEGLIIATNDGALSHHLTSPDHHVNKIYNVKVNGEVSQSLLTRLCSGLPIEGKSTRPLIGKILRKEGKNTWIQLQLTEGKKRQIRKLCKQVNKSVLRLLRISIGHITSGQLSEGKCRQLTDEEVNKLYKATD